MRTSHKLLQSPWFSRRIAPSCLRNGLFVSWSNVLELLLADGMHFAEFIHGIFAEEVCSARFAWNRFLVVLANKDTSVGIVYWSATNNATSELPRLVPIQRFSPWNCEYLPGHFKVIALELHYNFKKFLKLINNLNNLPWKNTQRKKV